MRNTLKIAAATGLVAASAGAEVCDVNPVMTELVDGYTVCASSALPAGRYSYRPAGVFAPDAAGWCEGVAGDGTGEWIELRLNEPYPLDRLVLYNGYVRRGADSYYENARPRHLLIETDTGLSVFLEARDTHDPQELLLGDFHRLQRIRVTLLDSYPGSKYHDTCLDALFPDFEAIRTLEWEQMQESGG